MKMIKNNFNWERKVEVLNLQMPNIEMISILSDLHKDGWWLMNISATNDKDHVACAFERSKVNHE